MCVMHIVLYRIEIQNGQPECEHSIFKTEEVASIQFEMINETKIVSRKHSGKSHTYMPDNRTIQKRGQLWAAVDIHLQHQWQPLDQQPDRLYYELNWHDTFSPNVLSLDGHQSRPNRCWCDSVWGYCTPTSSARVLCLTN